MKDIPLIVLTATIWAYWLGVGRMVIRARRRTRRLGGLVPTQEVERKMWWIWVPLVAAWIAVPTLAIHHDEALVAPPAWAREYPFAGVRAVAAVIAVACLALTAWCWRRMGDNWTMAIDDSRKTSLITDGLFARVRHPIYALSILLMLCSLAIVPTALMLVIAVTHIVLMRLKAGNEERYLLGLHGDAYRAYLARTGRFLPRMRGAAAA